MTSETHERPKVTVPELARMKALGEKISMITAYDVTFARLVDIAGVDMILVGDSVAMVVLGYDDTLQVTVDDMAHHTAAVARARPRALVVADLPWMSYHVDRADTVRHGLLPAPLAQQAVGRALDQVGDPYVWGATGPDSFDCSGLMWWSYDGVGIDLPRVSRDQAAGGGVPVAIEDLLPGDLVFFAAAAWDPGVVHHVGMYVGDGLMVDAPRPGEYVRVEPVSAEVALLELEGRFDVIARIDGGGISGQAGALRLGIARSLNGIDVEANRASLKKAGFLTRDARVTERKKAGLKKARKAPQYSKR